MRTAFTGVVQLVHKLGNDVQDHKRRIGELEEAQALTKKKSKAQYEARKLREQSKAILTAVSAVAASGDGQV